MAERSAGVTKRVVQQRTGALQAVRDALRLGASRVEAASRAKEAAAVRDGVPPADLTEEERSFLSQGILPGDYAVLKAIARDKGAEAAKLVFREGKAGPFSPSFGNPQSMLWTAQHSRGNPELNRMLAKIQPGDILLQTWNSPNDPVQTFTKGPFAHAVMCVSSGPPPEFIEAVGFTGDQKEPSHNRVRRSGLSDNLYPGITTRIVRPTEGMPEPERQRAIARAIAYVERQLGKPYDFALTDRHINQAYYCSNLVYFAYTAPEGAGIKMPIDKSIDRDAVLVAAQSVADALEPDDSGALAALVIKSLGPKGANGLPTPEVIANVLVDDIFPGCRTTRNLLPDEKARQSMKQVLVKVIEGNGFEGFKASLARLGKEEASGRFKTPVLGLFRRAWAHVKLAFALRKDMKGLLAESGLKKHEFYKATRKLLGAILPHSETFAASMFGVQDSRTRSLRGFLDKLEWINSSILSKSVFRWLGLGLLPGRATPGIKTDFVSPSDIAWAPLAHWDFNARPENPLDRPKSKN